MNKQTLKYIGLATVAAGAAYGSYKYGRKLLDKVTSMVAKEEVKTESKEEPVKETEEVTPEVKEETVVQETSIEEAVVEAVVEPEVKHDDVVAEEVDAVVDSEIAEVIEVAEETAEEVEEVLEPTSLEDAIYCFAKLLLLEDEGMEVQDKLNQYCDLILALKKERGLNAKAFKAVVKRAGLLPNSHEWTRLFSDLRQYELQMDSYEEA